MVARRLALSSLLALVAATPAMAQSSRKTGKPVVHFIWMGGNDCPPCVAWRQTELPKLQQTAAFQAVHFSYVPKTIRSGVPAAAFLPPDIRPFKELLDQASAGRTGSPQAALIVNGVVYDYFRSARLADDIEKMLQAALQGTRYPFARCLRIGPASGACEVPG